MSIRSIFLTLAVLVFISLVHSESLRGGEATFEVNEDQESKNPPSIYDCLQAASGEDECSAACDGQCVWCAEPVFGLCVTPGVAAKIGNLPFFKCDMHRVQSFEEEAK